MLTPVAALPVRAETKAETPAKNDMKLDEEPVLSVTAHTLTIDGKVLRYHATAGYIIQKEEEDKPLLTPEGRPPAAPESKTDSEKPKGDLKPKAKIFFVAYTLDDVPDVSKRPITYLFNGGPGSASIWLHMGAVSPRRANLTPEGEAPPPPYQVVDNESTWLDQTDLVFIDPVSTGFSRPTTKESAGQFHGVKEDIASIGDFIRLYTTRNGRWLSPKFIMGESYGTFRAAGLSDYLQSRYGLYLNGIVLVSTVLKYDEIRYTPENDEPFIGFLPGFAAAAWYHKKLSPEMEAKGVAEVAREAREFAGNEYALALGKGDAATADERQHVADQLSHFTGIPSSEFKLMKLRLSDFMFFDRLLLQEGRYLGRYDARITGISDAPGHLSAEEYDPSYEAVAPPFNAAFNDYVRRELKFESDIPYEGLVDVTPWKFASDDHGAPNTAEDLRKAMTRNPYLKLWVACGYYDLATPFFGVERSVASMNLDPAIRANLRFTYYEAGHMIYTRAASRAKFKADFLSFLNDSINQPTVNSAAR
jgi:carboxypeptidase C (cathepsin A)